MASIVSITFAQCKIELTQPIDGVIAFNSNEYAYILNVHVHERMWNLMWTNFNLSIRIHEKLCYLYNIYSADISKNMSCNLEKINKYYIQW